MSRNKNFTGTRLILNTFTIKLIEIVTNTASLTIESEVEFYSSRVKHHKIYNKNCEYEPPDKVIKCSRNENDQNQP